MGVLHMLNSNNKKLSLYRTPIYIIDHMNFWPKGGHKKLEWNVRFFWLRLYTHCIDNSDRQLAGHTDTSILQAGHDRAIHVDKVSSNIH